MDRARALVEEAIEIVHGWGLSSDMWEYQLPVFVDRGLRCVAYDRRGCGRSDQPGDGYDFDTLADDLAAVLDHLDLRDATLVAHSMGSAEVARYLTRHGAGRVARVALISPTLPYLQRDETNPEGVDPAAFEGIVAARPDRGLRSPRGPDDRRLHARGLRALLALAVRHPPRDEQLVAFAHAGQPALSPS